MNSEKAASDDAVARPRGRRLGLKLAGVGLGIAAVIAGTAAAYGVAQTTLYSASAFATDYVELLADGRAADALTVPGVTVDGASLDAARLTPTASDALLRSDALASLSDIHVTEERTEGDLTYVTVAYTAGAYPGSTTFAIEQTGSLGIAPTWRFAVSPLAVMDLTVTGSMRFQVNGFQVDKRQISVDGMDADPAAALPMLVFSPGLYSVSVDTAIATAAGAAVLSDSPMHEVPVSITAQPTEEFVSTVTERVNEFLTACATQEVLQPTGCPFGYFVDNRIASVPAWSIVAQPSIELVPDGAGWAIVPTDAMARIDVDIRSLRDGKVTETIEDVPFRLTGDITIQPDGTATIVVSSPDTR